jgi:hypothetical protein
VHVTQPTMEHACSNMTGENIGSADSIYYYSYIQRKSIPFTKNKTECATGVALIQIFLTGYRF